MNQSNFTYLAEEYPQLAKIGQLAERNTFIDPSTSLSKLRLLTEKLSKFILEYERIEEQEYTDQVKRIQLLFNNGVISQEINDLLHIIRKSGNKATHTGEGSAAEAKYILRQTVKVVKWFSAVYENLNAPEEFIMPLEQADDTAKVKDLEEELLRVKEAVKNYEEKVKKLTALTKDQKVERKERADRIVSKMEESEAETRERIDKQLRDAGWLCDTNTINYKIHKTLPEKGKYKAIAEWRCDNYWADYALFNGMELIGIVEAKKHNKNVMSVLEQAKRYSRSVNNNNDICFPEHANSDKFKVPFLFSTNGKAYLEQIKTMSGIWFWDARIQSNSPRALRNWFSPRDLIEMINYDQSQGEDKLAKSPYDYLQDKDGLSLRDYQVEAIKAVESKILSDKDERRALLAMATGTGKTRTMIGMCYRLIKSGRFRRILFLVDRRMLGKQAADSFKEVKIEGLQTFAEIYDLQELKQASAELDTKIHFATVQSMVKRVAYSENPPSIGDYDCIVVDEAHRGYTLDKEMEEEELILRDQKDFQSKYRMVLDYFDAYRIGLTATPAVHTAEIFGEPVYTYSYRKAVVEGYLIDFEPPYVFKTKLGREGIVWEKGDEVKVYDPEENAIESAGVTEDEIHVEIQSFNKKVINDSFNRNILNKLIADYGIHPDDPKKTLIFAATNIHADMIVSILRDELEELGENVDADAIVKITGEVPERDDLLNRYKNDQYPSIVVTVDLLTTGIDVPAICNIVFLRRVNSRILYDQMMGRATRKCDEIGKEVFKVYDCVGVTDIMAKETVMKPVAPLVNKSFAHLNEELAIIEDDYLREAKLDRIIAKLQRKTRSLNGDQMEQFKNLSGGLTANELGQKLKAADTTEMTKAINEYEHLWNYLDREKGKAFNYATLYSEHEDVVEDVQRAYEKNLKPKDYLESFADFIKQNKNTIAAINILCTKPSSLTRKDLKELRLILDEKGFNRVSLNAAYKDISNQDIVADIIAHVRTSALGSPLISHQERITRAIERIKKAHQWNSIQLKWLERIEVQLFAENIVTIEDLNKAPFDRHGGLKRMEKAFKNETSTIINELNEYLYA
ncbi:type I restriction-modification system endonuclease [Marinifilum sp. RC60d5]|uniref:type I restriction-modification system endonuclease n=1 Tax=Marinifilum sp. RC60d5 TaxID=3458414 RepID=UPI0040369E2B